MAVLVLVVLILAMAGHSSATWCICKEGVNVAALQKTLDYACGSGADCSQTHQTGACFNPNTVRAHCSYAVNSFFQKKGQAVGSCDFAGTAMVVTSDPSTTGCVYPASASATTSTPGTTTTPTINTPAGGSPLVTTTNSSSGLGGINNGYGPAGTGGGINTDVSDAAGILLVKMNSLQKFSTLMIILLFSGLVLSVGLK